MLPWNDIETRAAKFQITWKNCEGDERQQAQQFEMDFMHVFGVNFLDGLHEHQVKLLDGSIGYIDYLLPGKILIEMKSKGKSLNHAYTQAMSYVYALPSEDVPELLVLCDFSTMQVHNLKNGHKYNPFKVTALKRHVRMFGLLAGYGTSEDNKPEIELNTTASYKMAKLHDELKKFNYQGHHLELFLVRLLFCLFADDTGIFEKNAFENYVKASKADGSDLAMRIMVLFDTLNTPEEKRASNLSDELKMFRYINGKLFETPLPLASFNAQMRNILLNCCEFSWNNISPSIFGAMFQGVMNQEQRRELGAHYTSEENILKVIKPLFLDDLYTEFEKKKNTKKELTEFQNKLSTLTFLDPACGSGNFLLVAYQKLRELEAEVINLLYNESKSVQLSFTDVKSKVHVGQFFGIEVEDFPCEVAKVSMYLMNHLLDQSIGSKWGVNIVDFPIKESPNIVKGNALRLNWNELTGGHVDYIMGNPPFVGARLMGKEQKDDVAFIFSEEKTYGNFDYVTAWYYKAALFMDEHTFTKTAFVATNSICQGE